MIVLLSVYVSGEPRTQGSMRAFVRGRRAVVTHDSGPELKAWRTQVALQAKTQWRGSRPFDRPVQMQAFFALPRPSSHLRADGSLRASAPMWPAAKRDLDKLLRATLDALVEGGCLADDGLVVQLSAAKSYAASPEVEGLRLIVQEA